MGQEWPFEGRTDPASELCELTCSSRCYAGRRGAAVSLSASGKMLDGGAGDALLG